jgi:hypothetical protein
MYRSERYQFTLEYRKGIKQLISDILSRQGHHTERDPPMGGLNVSIAEIADVDTVTLANIRKEITEDPELQALARKIVTGWNTSGDDTPDCLRKYETFQESLGS